MQRSAAITTRTQTKNPQAYTLWSIKDAVFLATMSWTNLIFLSL